ncbi:transcription factor bHLH36 [Melia azedarach]|uniref:Transcription factor bHLH36 n=1 Tax=Melia azedarach TaxID=155640 RepID=A0ACC1WW89_MELAZ|nr:transcription factor bHLH36 [Melia azedarach]
MQGIESCKSILKTSSSLRYTQKLIFLMENNPSSSRTDRKTIERNRRNQMKALYSELNSLLPHQRPVEATSLPDQLDEAANYIKGLQTNLERMKERKDRLMGIEKPNRSMNSEAMTGFRSPQIEIHEMGSALEVVLITGLDCQFMFSETIRLLHEEGAEIVNASFSVVEDAVFHTIHSKVGDSASSGSHGAARISERLKKLVNDATAF